MANKKKSASGFEKLIERAKQIEDPDHREFAIKLFEFGKRFEEEDRKALLNTPVMQMALADHTQN